MDARQACVARVRPRSPYEAILGPAYATLHPQVRVAHEAPLRAEGWMDVVHGGHWLTVALVALMKLPAAGAGQRVALGVGCGAADEDETTLTWSRRIGESALETRLGRSDHGFPAWVLSALAMGVFVSGVRDLVASARLPRI